MYSIATLRLVVCFLIDCGAIDSVSQGRFKEQPDLLKAVLCINSKLKHNTGLLRADIAGVEAG